MGGQMTQLGAIGVAMRRAGYESPRERAERFMREAIAARALPAPSIAEFSRRVLEANDAALIWELFAEHRISTMSALYERVRAATVQEKFPAAPTPTVRAVAPSAAAPEAAPASRDEGRVAVDRQEANDAGVPVGLIAAADVARKSLLQTFQINKRPLGEVTAGEARGWAKSRARDARFIVLLTEGLPDHVLIGGAVDEAVAERAYALAEAADNG